MTRRYHAMLAKYNIGFNGQQSFIEGMENIEKANTDDFSELLKPFVISNHSNASSATSNMERVIEKNRKAIKLHSIKKKPERNYKKAKDKSYQQFYNQNEFNPELKNIWIRLGEAEFYKGDFLGAASTFSYIARHYASTPSMVEKSQLWIARSYVELNWLYEAESILSKLKIENLSKSNKGLMASVWADLAIRQNEYKNAIDYLKIAIEHEKNKKQRTRFYFVLAQLFEKTGNSTEAAKYYSLVSKSIPTYQMDFNATLNSLQLKEKNPQTAEKKLKKMARNENNKDYLDQIYTTIGKIYLQNKDTVKAVKNFDLAIEKSTKNGVEKGVPLVIVGNMYYKKREYVKAHPYYDEAAKIYTPDYIDYELINKRSEILSELVKEWNVVHLQDSLQSLAKMNEKDRLAAINRTIEKIKAEEKADEDKKLAEELKKNSDDFRMPMTQIGGRSDWYFYNTVTVNNGKNDFRKKWGNRKLEDNWRRNNKSEQLFDTSLQTDTAFLAHSDSTILSSDADENIPKFVITNDKKSVDYHLAQIPFTAAQKEKSDQQIADGLYGMGIIYKDKIEDYPLAHQTYEQFQKRFPNDERNLDVLFQRFLLASKTKDLNAASEFRKTILTDYPESKNAQLLADPNYIENQQKMFVEQDELYNETYSAFTKSDFQTVFDNTKLVKFKYPLSTLIPQFEFLNTLSIGRTTGSDKFTTALNELVENYPDNSISALAKDILALLKQGNIAQQGQTLGTLLSKREISNEQNEEGESNYFSELKFSPHRLLFVTDGSDEEINKLQYNLAIFNFSRFMIKDFGFALTKIDNTSKRALSVLNIASYNEAVWYKNTLATDSELMKLMQQINVEQIIISEENFEKLKSTFTIDEYLAFEQDVLAKSTPNSLLKASEKTTPTNKKTTVEIIDGTKLVEKTETEKTAQNTDKNVSKNNIEQRNESNLYKGLFDYQPNTTHFVAFYIPKGGRFNFNTIQTAIDNFNASHYSTMNLKVTLEEFNKESVIFVGNFTDAEIVKSYFMRLLKEQTIQKATQGVNKRNLIITRENFDKMIEKNALDIYFEFLKNFYLK